MSLPWYRHTQLVFSGGLAPLAAQRVDGTGTEQQGGPPLGAGDGLALTTCLQSALWRTWRQSLSDVAETWWDAGGIFACPDTDSFSARCQNREGHSPLALHTAAFVHVLVLLAAGYALCFGESINLT